MPRTNPLRNAAAKPRPEPTGTKPNNAELRSALEAAYAESRSPIWFKRALWNDPSRVVETVVTDPEDGKAGQAIGDSVLWGDWDEDECELEVNEKLGLWRRYSLDGQENEFRGQQARNAFNGDAVAPPKRHRKQRSPK